MTPALSEYKNNLIDRFKFNKWITLDRFNEHLEIIERDNGYGRQYSSIEAAYGALSQHFYKTREIYYGKNLKELDREFVKDKVDKLLNKKDKNDEEKLLLYNLSKNIETLLA